jgi:hypothetical protein
VTISRSIEMRIRKSLDILNALLGGVDWRGAENDADLARSIRHVEKILAFLSK